ncbi:glutaminase family protein [Gracilibacillus alcaliphilus]|uniref:glutaminase family protein n=1 Tax=Gracilibacillus alcaliphilus TaxID=1401441 RepID=UPI00195A6F1C|nr:glutaminase family protein [Gracilibacillus alcaliphilus]
MDVIRPPAVPLLTVDPYFNVWSSNDHLYDDHTHHWTYNAGGTTGIHGMTGMIRVDGKAYRFMGKLATNENDQELDHLEQIQLTVHPLTTIYVFEGAGITLQVEFMTPLLLDKLDVLSRPASYITFEVWANDQVQHDVQIYMDVTGEWCVHDTKQEVSWARYTLANDRTVMKMGSHDQPVLKRKGDDTRIDWGYLHVLPPADHSDSVIASSAVRQKWAANGVLPDIDDEHMPRSAEKNCPVMAAVINYGTVDQDKQSNYLVLAYNDIFSIEYFHQPLPGYWKRNGQEIDEILQAAAAEYPALRQECAVFDQQLNQQTTAAGGAAYRDITALAYRQAIAAHKLVLDNQQHILFLSKENNSNGCVGTVDISYPSTPLFLLYNPELVKGMMRPIFRFARSEEWPFDFAPHDVGCYPIANGQVYGDNKFENQMPIEESGNMLVMMAAICLAEDKIDFAQENWDLLTLWAQYLKNNGLDPKQQLCTDDFAGHLAHNTNLSIKAIMGIASYGLLCGWIGKQEEKKQWLDQAQQMAKEWEQMALDNDHYRLTFNQPDTWSLKYNLIWDDIFSLHLFSEDVKQKEVNYYISQQNRYGTPLDSRETYTKADWLVWAAALAEQREDTLSLIEPLWRFLHETPDRVPFSDWYDTKTAKRLNFKNRSVVGGVYILLLLQSDWNTNNHICLEENHV